ncbi:hypothetical protein PF005_g27743 [Phytophthora fragariae]|uniref:Uncharacterized protein n=1 Tax=Phytophthora fragariae TaxID=53985 RepID=A0A6A3W7A1_9STRA|nr:hypothetical protein PF009_g28333 [Phytophthora fragariae]KAE8969556.1 hypothetical protein PF011_g26757 [Phytophthora fragariae]KAE9073618.1 hypothetical protein PF006_g28696 [Phytophthora fragariae]KAE9076663.1 hypothetical protein PF007_g24540 [Phytophthora fragariae]KAE9169971.1 hypothetical protein PF005_g27743 [Phytophthora fragariae]
MASRVSARVRLTIRLTVSVGAGAGISMGWPRFCALRMRQLVCPNACQVTCVLYAR